MVPRVEIKIPVFHCIEEVAFIIKSESASPECITCTNALKGLIGNLFESVTYNIHCSTQQEQIIGVITDDGQWEHHIIFTIITTTVVNIKSGDVVSLISRFFSCDHCVFSQIVMNDRFMLYPSNK